jgi:hypothetical protein
MSEPFDSATDEQKEEVFGYLDRLRESGETNMFGAGQYVAETFDMDVFTAGEFLTAWMTTFHERHPEPA